MTNSLLKQLLKYQNKWVALNKTRTKIIASGSSIKDIEKAIESLKIKDVIVTRVLPQDRLYAPINY